MRFTALARLFCTRSTLSGRMTLRSKASSLDFILAQAAPDDPRLAQELWGLNFRNPLGMAAGFDKDARVWAPLLATGFGFVEVGTLTPKAQKRQSAPTHFPLRAGRSHHQPARLQQ